ncbi:MAG: EFR1 family ferrodoxin, partial [Spirochaetales bacterium]|nr:EFR1 family ferrodoxin [Spirochaetales bacterium]
SIEEVDKLNNASFKDKIIGFGYPVYKFLYPDNFNKIFPTINKLADNNKYFIFSSYTRFAANTFYYFSRKLDKNKFTQIAEESFKSPSCGISARKIFDDFEYESVMFFEDNINTKLDEFVSKIINSFKMATSKTDKISIKHKKKFVESLKLKIIKDIEKTKYPKLEINSSKCIVCGLCSKKCPDNNLVKESSHIKIKDQFNCLHCLRCMNHCPENAISFGELTLGENQYTLKIRNQLFEKSVSGFKEEYWKNFDKIVKIWRRNTIKYWIKNRK